MFVTWDVTRQSYNTRDASNELLLESGGDILFIAHKRQSDGEEQSLLNHLSGTAKRAAVLLKLLTTKNMVSVGMLRQEILMELQRIKITAKGAIIQRRQE